MTLHPILAALRRHKSGVVLITLQIALTLAIVCNAVFIIGQRIHMVNRPTGMNERDLFLVAQMYVGAPTSSDPAATERLDALQRADLETLRGLPEVASVAAINTLPLLDAGYNTAVGRKPHQHSGMATSIFFAGEQAIKTLGLQLIAGRNFSADEIAHSQPSFAHAPVGIVSEALAHALFPRGDALGKQLYLNGKSSPTTIIGIVARLQAPYSAQATGAAAWNSLLLPVRNDSVFTRYAVRARPGQMSTAMNEARKALLAVDPMRVMTNGFMGMVGIHPFATIRAKAYRADVGMAILMGVICVILLCVTGAGIVGLTSFWVGQRRKQIGIRRALGATRNHILHYFQLENLFIAGIGVVLGAIVAVGLNLWLMRQFQMERMPLVYVLVGVVVLLALGQGAVFAPALRASKVSPVEATRSV